METKSREEKNLSREEMLSYIEKQRPDMGEKLKKLLEKEGFLKARNVYGELYFGRSRPRSALRAPLLAEGGYRMAEGHYRYQAATCLSHFKPRRCRSTRPRRV